MTLTKLLGLSEDVSADGYLIDHMLEFAHWFMLILFIGWTCFFFWLLWRFRKDRNPKASYHGFRSHVSTHAEVAVVMIEVLLLLGFAFPIWARQIRQFPENDDDAVKIHAVAYQFGWNFHYPGPDGQFGRRDPRLISASNALGVDWSDPAAADDVVTLNTMRVPVDRKVAVRLTSKDVIHNFAAPNLRVAKDAIPGLQNPLWFTAVKEGDYDIICGQLCGAGHGIMKGTVSVIPQEDFDKFIQNNKSAPAGDKVAAVR